MYSICVLNNNGLAPRRVLRVGDACLGYFSCHGSLWRDISSEDACVENVFAAVSLRLWLARVLNDVYV